MRERHHPWHSPVLSAQGGMTYKHTCTTFITLPLLGRSRGGSRVPLAAVMPPVLLGLAFHVGPPRPGLLVARLAGLLGGPCPGAIVPPFVPPLHALRLRGRGTDAQHQQRRDHRSGALAYEPSLLHTTP